MGVKGHFVDRAVEVVAREIFVNADEESSVGRLRTDGARAGGDTVDLPSPRVTGAVEDEGTVVNLSHDGTRATATCGAAKEAANVTAGG